MDCPVPEHPTVPYFVYDCALWHVIVRNPTFECRIGHLAWSLRVGWCFYPPFTPYPFLAKRRLRWNARHWSASVSQEPGSHIRFCPYYEHPLSILWTKSVFTPVFVHIMHKITRFDRFFCSDDPNYPFCSIFGSNEFFQKNSIFMEMVQVNHFSKKHRYYSVNWNL